MWEEFVHHIYDFFYIIQWLLDTLKDLFIIVFRPFSWVFNFGKGFFKSAFSTAGELGIEASPVYQFSANIKEVFNSIPYFNLFLAVVGAGLGIFVLVFIIKKIIHV